MRSRQEKHRDKRSIGSGRGRLLIGCGIWVVVLLTCCGGRDPGAGGPGIEQVWTAWENGDVTSATELARDLQDSPGRRHLLFLCAFVQGDYEEALGHYGAIDSSYDRYADMEEPVVQAYMHLSRYREAERFADERGMGEALRRMLGVRAKQPMKVILRGVTEIPFADHDLTEYFPAFDVEINGRRLLAHLDTGGTFLHMGPNRAKELGIELFEGDEGRHGTEPVKTYHGIARSFGIGVALFENVPVVVLPSLVGSQDFIIFGTNILQQFLSTVDYPNERLILSPRGDPDAREKHLAMFSDDLIEIPFYMWGDHYMFAHGGVGEHKNLNFFIDSGLVSLHPKPEGGLRQASFWSSMESFDNWGFDSTEVRKGVFESRVPLYLGPLEQTGLLLIASEEVPYGTFGGIRIDGLLSHAFLKNYTWTLDFDEGRYLFQR